MSENNIELKYQGRVFKGQEGSRTIDVCTEEGKAFTCFVIDEDLVNKKHLEFEVLGWIGNIKLHDKVRYMVENKGYDDNINDEFIDNLEDSCLGYRERKVLANIINIERLGNTIRFISKERGKYFHTNLKGGF